MFLLRRKEKIMISKFRVILRFFIIIFSFIFLSAAVVLTGFELTLVNIIISSFILLSIFTFYFLLANFIFFQCNILTALKISAVLYSKNYFKLLFLFILTFIISLFSIFLIIGVYSGLILSLHYTERIFILQYGKSDDLKDLSELDNNIRQIKISEIVFRNFKR